MNNRWEGILQNTVSSQGQKVSAIKAKESLEDKIVGGLEGPNGLQENLGFILKAMRNYGRVLMDELGELIESQQGGCVGKG